MKRVFSIMLAILMVFVISSSAMAATFVPSISDKGAPEVVTKPDDNGNNVIGVITDGKGNELSTEYDDCIIITPVRDADTSKDLSDEKKQNLKDAFDELNKPGADLSELCPELDGLLGDNITVDDLVVMDLFDISSNCDNLDKYLTGGNNSLKVTFRLPLEGNQFVTAMVYVDGKWKAVPSVVNNGDGTVTVELNQLGPVAFLTTGNSENGLVDTDNSTDKNDSATQGTSTSPATSDGQYGEVILWGSVMGVSLLAVVVVLVATSRRKKKTDE